MTSTRGTDFDVVVVGFGPAGAVAAGLLGQAGLRTLVAEKVHEVYAKPRAIAIDHEILRLFQNLGVADKVLPYVEPFTASQHFGVDGQLIRRIDMIDPPYPMGYTPSMVFTQPPVEAALREHAASFPSVEVAFGLTFKSLTQDQSSVTLTFEDEAGATRTVTSGYAIGCDGASSSVRQALGIPFEDLVFDEPWLVVDVIANAAGLAKLPETAAQYCEPARPTTFIIGPGAHRRWEIMLNEDEDPRLMQEEAQVWKLLARWLTPEDGTLWRASSYRFHALVARDWAHGRVFIAGDAAHQQPPFIGQGMCQGLRDVSNLAWKLREVILEGQDPKLLDTYAEERGQHVRTLTSRIKAIGHAICERDPEAARARDARLIEQGGGRAPIVTRQDIVPPLETGLIAKKGHAANGTLFPQPWVLDATVRHRLDDIAGAGWRLVVDGRQPALDHSIVEACAATATGKLTTVIVLQPGSPPPAPHRDGILSVVELEGVLARWFDRHQCVAALVRPDHYVFGVVAPHADARHLEAAWLEPVLSAQLEEAV